jgi:hypothetical protein
MSGKAPATPAEFFAGHPEGWDLYAAARAAVDACGPCEVRVSTSQIAFRRRRGFAYVWRPGRWLAHPQADVVLSIALPRRLESPRFKQVAHPSPAVWMHHLELASPEDVDGEVRGWLAAAYDCAG